MSRSKSGRYSQKGSRKNYPKYKIEIYKNKSKKYQQQTQEIN